MSFYPYPFFTGCEKLDALVGDATVHSFRGFIVGDAGSATPTEVQVYMHDGSTLVIQNVQPGVPYAIPILGVASISTGMQEIWGLK